MSGDARLPTALQLRGVSKTFSAGAESCTAAVRALRSASVEIRDGEVLIVAGPAGSGKTTLLLCAAGLLRCDAGEIHGAARRIIYRDLMHPARTIDPLTPRAVLFLDSCDALGALPRARAMKVIGEAIRAGAAVVLAAREVQSCLELTPPAATVSIVHLRFGETSVEKLESQVVHRVAEASGASY
jgi:ABC-type dipeptide/oligopeptide/nickel transport system ATPase subunit